MSTKGIPITQIFHVSLPQKASGRLDADQQWLDVLDLCEQTPGFLRSYWGRSHEIPENVELHIGKCSVIVFVIKAESGDQYAKRSNSTISSSDLANIAKCSR